jgi:hypothetical protein
MNAFWIYRVGLRFFAWLWPQRQRGTPHLPGEANPCSLLAEWDKTETGGGPTAIRSKGVRLLPRSPLGHRRPGPLGRPYADASATFKPVLRGFAFG